MNQMVSELNLRLLKRAPFIATIALHAEVLVQERPGVEIAATDGKRIYLSPLGFLPRPPDDKLFIYAHEVLHCALSQVPRRGHRDPLLWNLAADIVVNRMLLESGFIVPRDSVREDALAHLSTEAVYEQLQSKQSRPRLGKGDLIGEGGEDDTDADLTRGYWQNVLRRAATLARMTKAGILPASQELGLVLGERQVDWRDVLWRYLIPTQDDYGSFDTRLIHQGIYVEALESSGLTVAVHIDSSGSLADAEAQGQFLAELKGILNAYPGVQVSLTYGDTELHGPFELTQDTTIPPPHGGGGTSFVPFFESVGDLGLDTPLIVFTDGYGTFPESCEQPCLWVVSEGGLLSAEFPFGEVARLAR